ncbi:hypothetical protein ACFPA8_16995 [Streptomyces ovatisporus]|uniref:Uncharacterized protein n=1 Tax=Streptomyces ovatisporus TaxID=1128682 RepID=A0ABV9AA71_9ACTN
MRDDDGAATTAGATTTAPAGRHVNDQARMPHRLGADSFRPVNLSVGEMDGC